MESYSYKTKGVCSREILFDIEDGKVYNIRFIMGCNGNTQGVGALAEGMEIDSVIEKLENINCNGRGTSCPDQLAKALKKVKESE